MKLKKLYEANKLWNGWKLQLHWHKLDWVDPKYNPIRVKPFSVYSKRFYIDKSDRTAHWVSHYEIK